MGNSKGNSVFGIPGMGFVSQTIHNGKPTFRAIRTITERWVDEDGIPRKKKRQIKGYGATPTLAWSRMEANVARYNERTADGTILPPLPKTKSPLVSEWLNEWFHDFSFQQGKRPGTIANYENKIRYHITPHIGDIRLADLNRDHLRKLIYDTLPAKTDKHGEPLLGSSPLRAVHHILNMALTEAVHRELIPANPLVAVRRPKRDKPRHIQPDDIRWIPREIIKRYGRSPATARWILAFYGLRQSERLGLQVRSLTYLNDTKTPTQLKITHQLEPGTLDVVNHTKTDAGERVLTLPKETSEILLTWFRQRKEWEQSPEWNPEPRHADLFFTTPTGKPITHQQDRREWSKLLDELKPKHRPTIHQLRHISATILADTGTPPQVARLILGHASTAMTLYYTHYNARTTAVATERAEKNLFSKLHAVENPKRKQKPKEEEQPSS